MTAWASSSDERARVVLEGVDRVGYHIDGRYYFTPFPGCLRSCLAFLGEAYTYEYLLGVSGMAFRLLWNSGRWDLGNVGDLSMGSTEPHRRAFQAVGYGHEILRNEGYPFEHDDEGVGFLGRPGRHDEFREGIAESVGHRSHPVIAWGVLGPPECCIVTGYDAGGDVLIGWSYFQDFSEFSTEVEFEASGYFRKGDWFEDTVGLVLIGGKEDRPPPREIYCNALKWALEVMRTPMVGARHNGLAAYSAWAEALQRDEDFPQGDMEFLRERKGVHYDAMAMVAERGEAAKFVRQVAAYEPTMKVELLEAARCLQQAHDTMARWWEVIGGMCDEETQVRKLADPQVRRQFVPIVLHARDKDAQAAERIERALAK